MSPHGKTVECAAVIILFDGEDDCPKDLGANVRTWARNVVDGKPRDVVITYREYETWFLAAVESLRGSYGIRADAIAPTDPESKRNAQCQGRSQRVHASGPSLFLDRLSIIHEQSLRHGTGLSTEPLFSQARQGGQGRAHAAPPTAPHVVSDSMAT
jgi:hypothetical protein